MLVVLARRGVVSRVGRSENVARRHRVLQNDERNPHERVKSPGYAPMYSMTPKRGKQ